jgi:hypothetical protein
MKVTRAAWTAVTWLEHVSDDDNAGWETGGFAPLASGQFPKVFEERKYLRAARQNRGRRP